MAKYVCHNKHAFVVAKDVFCCDKIMFVVTKVLSWQKYVCHNKHAFVVAKDMFCCNKHVFVATKMILVAAPTNDSFRAGVFVVQIA